MRLQGAVVAGSLLSLALVAGPWGAVGGSRVSFPTPPVSGSFVSDEAELIAPADREEIDRLAAALNRDRGYPVTVVTIESLGAHAAADHTIERYASEMLRAWNREADRRGYGLLLLVSAGDRRARIELGSQWRGIHDGRAREVMDSLILPAFRRGDFSRGILDGVRGFDAMGRQLALPVAPRPWWLYPAIASGIVVLTGAVISLGRSGRRGLAWAAGAFLGAILLSRAISWARGEDGDSGEGVTGNW